MPKKQVPALVVKQWLPEWDDVEFDKAAFRRKPRNHFLVVSLGASEVRRLTGIQRRSPTGARALDLGIQREYEAGRSREIADYVKHGFPWSGLSKTKRNNPKFADLVKPGWLPTAIVANILGADDTRDEQRVHRDDRIDVAIHADGTASINLPDTSHDDWTLAGDLPPLEVIDGQHRLWAFDGQQDDINEYQLPVVAFYGLDRSWQAYLFYTINIKPKRINSSLAFDLYPLLRTEDWLDRFDDQVYRTSRAQELTELLWSHPDSPWFQRIDMLGTYRRTLVTQNSWVRSLQATIIKTWEGPGIKIGGLFGAPIGTDKLALPWSRIQQSAFLIYAWSQLALEVQNSDSEWADKLRDSLDVIADPAFEGSATMLNSDMGVRGFLYVINDLCYVNAEGLQLRRWRCPSESKPTVAAVRHAIASLDDEPVGHYIRQVVKQLATYDWRSSKASGLSEEERQSKARFRGGTGYKELRIELLRYLATHSREMADTVQEIAHRLKYDIFT